MTAPLAFIVYEKLLPGTQLSNKLRDLGYRVESCHVPAEAAERASRLRPLVVLMDLEASQADPCAVIREMKASEATRHLPVLAFASGGRAELQAAARKAGASLVAGEEAILAQLPMLLEHVLQVD